MGLWPAESNTLPFYPLKSSAAGRRSALTGAGAVGFRSPARKAGAGPFAAFRPCAGAGLSGGRPGPARAPGSFPSAPCL